MAFARTMNSVSINPLFVQLILATFVTLALCHLAWAGTGTEAKSQSLNIISLDYCADQYAIKLAPANARLRLSVNATQSFSYLKSQAQAYPQQAARLEHIVRAKPDFVIRSYGGGALMTQRLSSLGIPVIQLQFSQDFESIYDNIFAVSKAFGRVEQGQQLIEHTRSRLANIQQHTEKQAQQAPHKIPPRLLYLTASGATAGQNTLINSVVYQAGFNNYIQRDGWPTLSLEQLSLSQPQHIATAFFNPKQYLHFWSSVHHPVAKHLLASTPVVELNSSTLACAAWYTADSVEKLANAKAGYE